MTINLVKYYRKMRQCSYIPCIVLLILSYKVCIISSFLTPRQSYTSSFSSRAVDPSPSSSTQLHDWWFGGTERPDDDRDECELVAVRIERTSANSRKIWGEISIDAPLEDVWAILTDYDRLAVHVPNLVESRRVRGGRSSGGEQGDGSYRCRLYQKGAQKIIGFEFGASVTMDMVEKMYSNVEQGIGFKCVESPFFSEFDGEWLVTETVGPDGVSPLCNLRYVVDVRPRGPVPVAALEWRIREDVPTNLRAVKNASIDVGAAGVEAFRNGTVSRATRQLKASANQVVNQTKSQIGKARDFVGRLSDSRTLQPSYMTVPVKWDNDETMAAYLNNSNRRN